MKNYETGEIKKLDYIPDKAQILVNTIKNECVCNNLLEHVYKLKIGRVSIHYNSK